MTHNKTQTLAKRVLVLATSLLLVPTLALAVPGQVTQQGRLVDASGVGLSGSHTIAFSLFSDSAPDATLTDMSLKLDTRSPLCWVGVESTRLDPI